MPSAIMDMRRRVRQVRSIESLQKLHEAHKLYHGIALTSEGRASVLRIVEAGMLLTIRRRSQSFFMAGLMLMSAAAAHAQSTGTRPPVDHDQVFSVNPITSMFKVFNAEYERKLTPFTTWGAQGSFLDIGGFDYRSANLLFRYYPQRAALTGFFIGGRTGIHHVSVDSADGASANFSGPAWTSGTAG